MFRIIFRRMDVFSLSVALRGTGDGVDRGLGGGVAIVVSEAIQKEADIGVGLIYPMRLRDGVLG